MELKPHHRLIDRLYRAGILKKAVTAADDRARSAGEGRTFTVFLAKCVGTGFFIGYAPFAQGTFGSLVVPLMYMVLPGKTLEGYYLSSIIAVALALMFYMLGVWASGVCEKLWGHDPGRVVIDEIVGMLVTLAFVPLSIVTVWAGFLLFRVFDILKPPPVGYFERFRSGWGVMNDDVAAGVLANLCLRIVVFLLYRI